MWFCKKNATQPKVVITTSEDLELEVVTSYKYLGERHCSLYSSVNWSSLYTCRKTHWLMLIYKTLLCLTPPCLRYLLQPSSSTYNTRSARHTLLKVPRVHTFLGRSSLHFTAPSDWNKQQQTLKLDSFISISSFKDSIMDTLTDSCGCFV